MKVKFAVLLVALFAPWSVFGANFWWMHETICQIDNTPCYSGLSAGIDSSLETGWDISGRCRGKKYVCPEAMSPVGDDVVTMERADILRGDGISSDFDMSVYVADQNCYGSRKSKNNGTMVSVKGVYVNVWCSGILSDPTYETPDGEVTTGEQPVCTDLAKFGYVAVLNGRCYGKYYNPSEYAIECNDDTPTLVLLNGAEYVSGDGGLTASKASSIFNTMASVSAAQRGIYFQ